MRAGWTVVALGAIAACGQGDSVRAKVTTFTDDHGRTAVGIRPDAEAPRIVEVLTAALAGSPEVAVVALEDKGRREVCRLKAAPALHDPHAVEKPPPILSILVEPNLVWYGISRINEESMSDPSLEVIRAVGGSMAKDPWFQDNRVAELAFLPEVKGAMAITVIEGLCPSWSSFRLVAPDALTSRPAPAKPPSPKPQP